MHLLVGGPSRAWTVFLACEDWKKPRIFREAYMSLTWCSKMVQTKRRKLVTASLLFHCIDWCSCLRYWNEFFSAVFHVLDWSFLVLHLEGNVCIWISKVIWPWMDCFWVFFRKWLLSLTSYLYGLKSARIDQLLIFINGISCWEANSRSTYC